MKRIIQHSYFILALIIMGSAQLFAQSDTVNIHPHEIEFENTFQRLEGISIINSLTETLQIDTVYYNSNLYSIRFDSYNKYPLHLAPGDTLMMDCILSGYFQVAASDTTDSLMISFNNHKTKRFVKIKIDFHQEDVREGKISGKVTSNGNPLDSVNINFYYNGIYLYRSTKTDSQGIYLSNLPAGPYTVSAYKNGYNLTFLNNKPDPLSANIVTITHNQDSIATADFNLTPDSSTGISVSGLIRDVLSKAAIGSGIVVIRKGIHTPSKISGTNSSDTYTAIVNPDGTYKIDNLSAGKYYVQSFANYYTPTFYSLTNSGATDWKQGDSLNVTGGIISNLNINMPRDSSFGGGIISGIIKSSKPDFTFPDIIVYAQSIYSNTEVSYSFVDPIGNYSIKDLQYGTYRVLAQKIGYDNVISGQVAITATNPLNKIDLSFDTTSLQNNPTYPSTYILYQNFPNPFNPSTTIRLHLGKSSFVTVNVTNILGQQVEVLEKGFLQAGNYNFTFNAKNLSSGTYFVSMITEEGMQVKKMLLIR